MFIPTIAAAGMLLLCWARIDTVQSMWAFVAIYGYFGAGVQSLFPAALSSLTDNPNKMGVRIGMAFSIVSIASLSGPPIAGRLIEVRNGVYIGAQIFGGVAMLTGSLFVGTTRILKHGWTLKGRM